MRAATSLRWVKRTVLAVLVAVVVLWTVVPIGWMALSSLKPEGSITAATPDVSFTPTLDNYVGLFSGAGSIFSYARNSLLAAGLSTVISVVLGCFAGYGLARSRMRGKQHLSFWIISTRMAPIAAIIVPLYLIFRNLGLLDSVAGLVVAYLTFNLPFAIWLMYAFFVDLPPVLEESAMVDGATRFQAFRHVAVPLMTPGIVTTAILCFLFAWNDYAFASTFSGPSSETIPVLAAQVVSQTGIDWGALTAIATVVVLPMIAVGIAVRRWLVQGLTLGAVKE